MAPMENIHVEKQTTEKYISQDAIDHKDYKHLQDDEKVNTSRKTHVKEQTTDTYMSI